MSITSSLAFAEPCLPGLDFDMEFILYALSSTQQYLPTFRVRISTRVVLAYGSLVHRLWFGLMTVAIDSLTTHKLRTSKMSPFCPNSPTMNGSNF